MLCPAHSRLAWGQQFQWRCLVSEGVPTLKFGHSSSRLNVIDLLLIYNNFAWSLSLLLIYIVNEHELVGRSYHSSKEQGRVSWETYEVLEKEWRSRESRGLGIGGNRATMRKQVKRTRTMWLQVVSLKSCITNADTDAHALKERHFGVYWCIFDADTMWCKMIEIRSSQIKIVNVSQLIQSLEGPLVRDLKPCLWGNQKVES